MDSGVKRRVAFVINSLQPGGAEHVLLDTVKYLRRFYEIVVYVCVEYIDADSSLMPAMRELVEVRSLIRYRGKGSFLQRFPYRLKSRLTQDRWDRLGPEKTFEAVFGDERFDMVIAYLEGLSTRIVAGAPEGVAKYAWVHTDMIANPISENHYLCPEDEAAAYRAFDKVFAVSSDVADSVRRKFGVDAEFVQNIVDDAAVRTKASSEPNPYPEDGLSTVVLVGRHSEVKGYGRFLGVVRRLQREGFAFRTCFVGEGDLTQSLKEQCERDRLENVGFAGYRPNPYPYIANADLLVCSSFAEGFSGTVVEALILGVPVLTSDCAGMRDILGAGYEYGMIVPNSEDGLYQGLRTLLADPMALAEYRKAAGERGAEFSTSVLGGRLVAALENGIDQD